MDYHVFDLVGGLKDHKLKAGLFHLNRFVSWIAKIFEYFRFCSLIFFIFLRHVIST